MLSEDVLRAVGVPESESMLKLHKYRPKLAREELAKNGANSLLREPLVRDGYPTSKRVCAKVSGFKLSISPLPKNRLKASIVGQRR